MIKRNSNSLFYKVVRLAGIGLISIGSSFYSGCETLMNYDDIISDHVEKFETKHSYNFNGNIIDNAAGKPFLMYTKDKDKKSEDKTNIVHKDDKKSNKH